jgi:hypothetical protein
MSGGLRGLLGRGLPFRGYTAGWLLAQVGLAGTLSLFGSIFVALVLATGRLQVPFGQLWLLITAGFLLQWLLRTVDVPAPMPAPAADPTGFELDAAPYPQVDRWQRRLSISDRDPQWYAGVVRDRVAVVVAERLRQRHGVRLDTDPDRARQHLGNELYGFLTDPVVHTPSPAELHRLVTRMEEI